jgi:hypothetical protein
MGKGRFVNQKLGKNASRKAGLLKSELAIKTRRNSPPRPLNLPALNKEIPPRCRGVRRKLQSSHEGTISP